MSTHERANCENYNPSLGAYFFEARISMVKCDRPAAWEVFVNPPRDGNDGTVRLCEHCNKWEYVTFRRGKLAAKEITQ